MEKEPNLEYNYEEEEEEEDEEQENENKDNIDNNKEDTKQENGKVEENNINNEQPENKKEEEKKEEDQEKDKVKDDLENLGKNYMEDDENIISTSSEKEENKNKENADNPEIPENKKEQIIEEIDTTVPKNNTNDNNNLEQGGENNNTVKGTSQNTICHRLIPKGLDIDITKRVYFKCYKMKTKSNIISFITGSKKVKIPYLIFLDENFYYMVKDKPVNQNNENIRRVGNRYDLTKISNFQTRKINNEYEFAFEFMYEDYFDRIYKLLYFEPKDAELFFEVFQQFADNLGLDLPGNIIGIGDEDDKEEEEEEDEGDEGEEKEENEKEENEKEENEN